MSSIHQENKQYHYAGQIAELLCYANEHGSEIDVNSNWIHAHFKYFYKKNKIKKNCYYCTMHRHKYVHARNPQDGNIWDFGLRLGDYSIFIYLFIYYFRYGLWKQDSLDQCFWTGWSWARFEWVAECTAKEMTSTTKKRNSKCFFIFILKDVHESCWHFCQMQFKQRVPEKNMLSRFSVCGQMRCWQA